MTRLHVPCPLTLETEIALPEDSAHHFIRVLRAQALGRARDIERGIAAAVDRNTSAFIERAVTGCAVGDPFSDQLIFPRYSHMAICRADC